MSYDLFSIPFHPTLAAEYQVLKLNKGFSNGSTSYMYHDPVRDETLEIRREAF